jgi:chaperonin cofactor prefoldin
MALSNNTAKGKMPVDANKVEQLQQLEIELRQIFEEKKILERDQVECEAAIQELEKSPVAYKIIGSIMVEVKPAELLSATKERVASITKKLVNLSTREADLATQHKIIVTQSTAK